MSLTFELRINTELIGAVEITRESESYSTDPDSVNTYLWSYSPDGVHWTIPAGIQHRYGDGAILLAHKVLGEVALRYQIAGEMTHG